jgi:hypothetical protein
MPNDENIPSFGIRHSRIRHSYSVSTIARPPYWPQLGQITCDGFIVPHLGQACSCLACIAWCERRMPVREFDCLRLGTAMGTPVDRTESFGLLRKPLAYDKRLDFVKAGGAKTAMKMAKFHDVSWDSFLITTRQDTPQIQTPSTV